MTSSTNLNQDAAINADDQPVLVLAGPGSGKTAVLTGRIRHLVETSRGQHFRLLALTFTRAAAVEMRERCRDLGDRELSRVLFGTYHSFANSLLQQHGSHIGLSPDFVIITDDVERREILDEVILKLGLELDQDSTRVLPLLDRVFERCRSVSEVEDQISDPSLAAAVERLYTAYADECVRRNAVDYPLMIVLARDLLLAKPFIGAQVRSSYRHICVDEFQDTNVAQLALLECLLHHSARGLFVVADADQTIFQWNGASPERIREIQTEYDMRVVQLPESYRCPPDVIEAANNLITHNNDRIFPSKLTSRSLVAGSYSILSYGSFDDEISSLADRLAEQRALGSVAVLARSKRLLDPAAKAAAAARIPIYAPSKKVTFETAPLSLLTACLKLAIKPTDRTAVKVLCKATYDLTAIPIEPADVEVYAGANGTGSLAAWVEIVWPHLKPRAFEPVRDWILTKLIPRRHYRGFAEIVFAWASAVSVSLSDDLDYAIERDIWMKLEVSIAGLPGHERPLSDFLREVDLAPKVSDQAPGTVAFLTVHGAKGLEFDYVNLIGAAEAHFPSFQAVRTGAASISMREERRNFFVAITRTRAYLTISHATWYFGYRCMPSRFLAEMIDQVA